MMRLLSPRSRGNQLIGYCMIRRTTDVLYDQSHLGALQLSMVNLVTFLLSFDALSEVPGVPRRWALYPTASSLSLEIVL
jgi:hypothetical protein